MARHHTPPKLARLETTIRTLLARGETNAYVIGQRFDEIAKQQLHTDAGYKTLEAYADDRFTQGYSTLKRYRRVAAVFAKRFVVKYGTTKLDLGLDYIALTPEHERPSDLFHLAVRVPGKNHSVSEVPFAKCTAGQLTRAIEHARMKPTAHDDVSEARAKRSAIALQALVASPKGVHKHAPLVRAHLTDERSVRFDLVGIDEEDLERVARAMLAMVAKRGKKRAAA